MAGYLSSEKDRIRSRLNQIEDLVFKKGDDTL